MYCSTGRANQRANYTPETPGGLSLTPLSKTSSAPLYADHVTSPCQSPDRQYLPDPALHSVAGRLENRQQVIPDSDVTMTSR